MATDKSSEHDARDYTRRLYKHVEDWYTNADNKAQILLTLNGLFLGALGSAALFSGNSIRTAVSLFGFETFLFFLIFLFCLGASVTCSLFCLKSRLHPNHMKQDELAIPANLWFFQMVCAVRPREFVEKLHGVNAEREIEILARNIQTFASNVVRKHMWFNNGYRFFVLGLICFVVFMSSYVARVFLMTLDNRPEIISLECLNKLRGFYSTELLFIGVSIVAAFEAAYWCLEYREKQKLKRFADVVHFALDPPHHSKEASSRRE